MTRLISSLVFFHEAADEAEDEDGNYKTRDNQYDLKTRHVYVTFLSVDSLKILSYRKLKLVDEDLLEGINAILFVEDKHCFLVVDGIYRAETQRAIAVGDQDGVTRNASRAFVAIRECLDIRQQHKRQKRFLENVFLTIYQVASVMHGLTNLEFIIQWVIIGTCDSHTTVTDSSVN